GGHGGFAAVAEGSADLNRPSTEPLFPLAQRRGGSIQPQPVRDRELKTGSDSQKPLPQRRERLPLRFDLERKFSQRGNQGRRAGDRHSWAHPSGQRGGGGECHLTMSLGLLAQDERLACQGGGFRDAPLDRKSR